MASVLRPALPLMAGRAVAFTATFLIPVVIVRIFDQASVGTYKQVFLIYGTLFGIAQFGLAESLYYFLPTYPQSGGKLAANATLLLGGLGVIAAGVSVWGAAGMARWLGNEQLETLLPFLGIYLALTLTTAGLEITMVSRSRFRLAAISIAGSEIIRSAMFLAPALLTGDLRWLLAGGVVYGILRLAAHLSFLRLEFKGEFQPDRRLLRRQLGYALPFQLAVGVEILQLNLHQYFVSYSFDPAIFAIYAVGCLQIPTSEFVAAPLSNVMMVRMSEHLNEGRASEVRTVWDDTTRKLMLMMIPLAGFFIVLAPDLFTLLFTSAYAASVPVFCIWAFTIALQAFPIDSALRVYAATRTILALNIVRLIFIVSFIGLAMSRFGILGPAMVTIASMAIGKALGLLRISQLMSSGIRKVLDWRVAAASILAAVVCWFIAYEVRSHLALAPVTGLAVSGGVYAASLGAMMGTWWIFRTRAVKTCAELPGSSV